MAQEFDLTDKFSNHEDIVFNVICLDREGQPISAPAAATVTVTISDIFSGADIVTMNAGPEVVLFDAQTATFQIAMSDESRDTLEPGKTYDINIHSDSVPEGSLHQLTGLIRLLEA